MQKLKILVLLCSVSVSVSIAQIIESKLFPSDGFKADRFGFSVSVSEDFAIIGVPYDDDNAIQAGAAYIFKKEGSRWIEVEKLIASDGAFDDRFGVSVSICGDYAVVGAYWNH